MEIVVKNPLQKAKILLPQIINMIKVEECNNRKVKYLCIGLPLLLARMCLFLRLIRLAKSVLGLSISYANYEDEEYKKLMKKKHKWLAATGESFYCFHLKALVELLNLALGKK